MEIEGFYPVIIEESRYSGSYSRGRFVLTAGTPNPREHTNAFAGDVQCRSFWEDIDEAAILTVDTPFGDEMDVLVMSGDDPTELLEEAREIAAEYRGESE